MADAIPEYLLIGHIAHDVTPHGPHLGGTVSYAARTAVAFGLRVGIVTSAASDEPLLNDLPAEALVISVPAPHTTTFENRYTANGRIQYMYHRATPLSLEAVPPTWQRARLVHLAPIAYEVDSALAGAFGTSRVCATPQGWMRRREQDGRVQAIDWVAAEQVLPQTRLTVLSEEDIKHNPALEGDFAALAPLMVVTRGAQGGTLYQNGQARDFSAPLTEEVEPTGAGDIFATALHIALDRLGDLDAALGIATQLASQSVARRGYASLPTPQEVADAWQRWAGVPGPGTPPIDKDKPT